MNRAILAIAAETFLAIALPMLFQDAQPAPTIYVSADECTGAKGVYRWDVKTDHEAPPDAAIPIKPSDMAAWPVPRGKYTMHTPRSGREKNWYVLTGRVVSGKCEHDGDVHLQICDVGQILNENAAQCVAEVPCNQHPATDSPWSEIRAEIFAWAGNQAIPGGIGTDGKPKAFTMFPFNVESSRPLYFQSPTISRAKWHPVIRVVGKAFWDGQHSVQRTNRRADDNVSVWELHPIMELEVVK